MKIPKEIKVGGHIFKIKLTDIGTRKNLLGEIDTTTNVIEIDKDAVQSQKEATLIHEIFHALNTTFDGNQYTHSLLDSLSEQFYQVLKDNKLIK